MSPRAPLDPVELQLFRHLLNAVPEEMGVALTRSAFSPNIKERRDSSCAIVGPQGRLVAQASHIPVHLGAVHTSAVQILETLELRDGDVVLVNDPWCGGTHLPDVTLLAPLFHEGRLAFAAMVRAHHADVGGATPGSMGRAADLFGEGLVIPPVRLVRAGSLDEDLLRLFLANTRTPEERRGDLRAQLSCVALGCRRLAELLGKHEDRLFHAIEDLEEHARRATRALIRRLPGGVHRAECRLDGPGSPRLQVAVEVGEERLRIDFAGSSEQDASPFNANPSITTSAVFYVVRLLLGEDLPTNSGCLDPVEIAIPEGSLLNPRRPAAVAMGNVETSQRIVDLLLQVFAQLLPDEVAAASQGTMNNLSVGGVDATGRAFTFYETLGGGIGAGPKGAGESALQSHMTNTLNTPIEAMESAWPLRVRTLRLREGSGGRGRHPGGEGLVKEIEALSPLRVNVVATRRRSGAPGTAGGGDGAPGHETVIRGDSSEELPSEGCTLEPHDRLRIETPGGGGFGRESE